MGDSALQTKKKAAARKASPARPKAAGDNKAAGRGKAGKASSAKSSEGSESVRTKKNVVHRRPTGASLADFVGDDAEEARKAVEKVQLEAANDSASDSGGSDASSEEEEIAAPKKQSLPVRVSSPDGEHVGGPGSPGKRPVPEHLVEEHGAAALLKNAEHARIVEELAERALEDQGLIAPTEDTFDREKLTVANTMANVNPELRLQLKFDPDRGINIKGTGCIRAKSKYSGRDLQNAEDEPWYLQKDVRHIEYDSDGELPEKINSGKWLLRFNFESDVVSKINKVLGLPAEDVGEEQVQPIWHAINSQVNGAKHGARALVDRLMGSKGEEIYMAMYILDHCFLQCDQEFFEEVASEALIDRLMSVATDNAFDDDTKEMAEHILHSWGLAIHNLIGANNAAFMDLYRDLSAKAQKGSKGSKEEAALYSTKLSKLVAKATDRKLVAPDDRMNRVICERLVVDTKSHRDVARAIQKRLRKDNDEVRLLSLTLMDCALDFSSYEFFAELSTWDLLHDMQKVLRKGNSAVQEISCDILLKMEDKHVHMKENLPDLFTQFRAKYKDRFPASFPTLNVTYMGNTPFYSLDHQDDE